MSSTHVIVGTGPLGLSVMHALQTREGAAVRMLSRSGVRGTIPAHVEVVACDAYNVSALTQAARGAHTIYQCAQPAYTEWPEKFPPLQAAIVEAASSLGATLVVGDNLYMYGPTGGQPLREDMPYNATGKKGLTRAKMANQLFEAHKAGRVRMVIGRASDFYGEGVHNSMLGDIVFENLKKSKAAMAIGNVDLPHSFTYIGDFGRALVMLGEAREAWGQAWHVPNAEPKISTRAMIERIAKALGVPAKISVMPKLVFEALSLLHPMLRELRESRHQFNEPYIVDHSKFAKMFGDISTPIEQALAQTSGAR